jgi:alkanesulfonate monooxygenase SsuD/methylene tetrahydromethanopterin reductase-like flavin-dependent oxidoreductase (luciferase family)
MTSTATTRFSVIRPTVLEGGITLTALAQATRRVRHGTLVTGIHYRHPAVLANMAATLDIVSGGRLELGVGAGWNQEESGAYGIELGSPRERSDRFEEACEVITALLSQDITTFAGSYYQLTEARCEPKPVQRPHPPIIGRQRRRTLRRTLRPALNWSGHSRAAHLRAGRAVPALADPAATRPRSRSVTCCTGDKRRQRPALRRSARLASNWRS